jgi:CHAT domain-containing protein
VRGLLYAGAHAVLLTLWDAYDGSTAEFMTAFYQQVNKGRTKAQAAQGAMRELRESRPHPFYWAPFVLIGDAEAPCARLQAGPFAAQAASEGSGF